MRKFCVITTGRAGSTSFMNALAAPDDIAVPGKQVDSFDHEILRLRTPDRYWQSYAALSGIPVTDELSLVRAFSHSNAGAQFAGFKTMPNRHRFLQQMLDEHGMRMICIYRHDVPSTIASFIAAFDAGSWRREGERQSHQVFSGGKLATRADAHLNFLIRCTRLFARLPGAIKIAFEDLCDPDFANAALEEFFERPVCLPKPRPPVDGSTYVENWPQLVRDVARWLAALGHPTPRGPGVK
ncbi:MAG: hypothetical protein ACU85U_08870 [Gammaproteobacteria bacterium]